MARKRSFRFGLPIGFAGRYACPMPRIEGIQDAACSHFGIERMIESIFVIMALHSRQKFPSNLRPKAFSQSVGPDALLLQGFHQIYRRDV